MKKGRFNQRSVNMIVVSLLLIIVNMTLGFVLTGQSNKALRSLIESRMLDISNTAADMLDGDELERLQAEDEATEPYQRAIRTLKCFLDNIELEYIYCVRDMGGGNFVFTIDPEPVDPGEFGSPVVSTEALRNAANGTPAFDETPYEDRWGRFYSAYTPVFNSQGKVAGIVAVDFSADWFERQISTQARSIMIICVLSLLIGAMIVVVLTDRSRKKYRQLYAQMNVLADNVRDLVREVGGENDALKLSDSDRPAEQSQSRGDDIEELGEKILSMQEILRSEIATVHRQAYIDALTSVGNKAAYLDAVKLTEQKIREGGAVFSVATFDINGLKEINDRCGHELGDQVLVDAARVLRQVFDFDSIFRYGGDEFIVILPDAGAEETERLFERVDRQLEQENRTEHPYQAPLRLSKGYATYDAAADDGFQTVFRRADDNMYRDKDAYYARIADRNRR